MPRERTPSKSILAKYAVKYYGIPQDMAMRWATNYQEKFGYESFSWETYYSRLAQGMEHGLDTEGVMAVVAGEAGEETLGTSLPHEQEGWQWIDKTLDEIPDAEFVESPEYEAGEYVEGPEYESGKFHGFEPEGGWGEFESGLFGEWMAKVSPGIEAEMASRGLSRSSDFERAYGLASIEGAYRASQQRYGMERDEMSRQTTWESEEARREQEYGMSESGRRTDWEADQALREWESSENAARREQEQSRYMTEQEWRKKLAGREELYNYYNMIGGTQSGGFNFSEDYMSSDEGPTEWEAGLGTAGETVGELIS